MKFSINWHKQCLANRQLSLEKEQAKLEAQQMRLERDKGETAFYAQQIEEAEKRKLDGFDSERFLKGKK